MDPATLGSMAVSIFAPVLAQTGKAAGERIGEEAGAHMDSLLATIRRKFESDQDTYAGQTLKRLEEKPDIEARRRALADTIAEKADTDSAFKADLEQLVNSARADPGTMQFLTNVYGGQVDEILNIGSVQTLNIGRRAD